MIASASFLLRIGDSRTRSGGEIPESVLAISWQALEFTIKNMPNLADIVLCGVEAFRTFQDSGALKGNGSQFSAGERQ